jgi:hypothetical protein
MSKNLEQYFCVYSETIYVRAQLFGEKEPFDVACVKTQESPMNNHVGASKSIFFTCPDIGAIIFMIFF